MIEKSSLRAPSGKTRVVSYKGGYYYVGDYNDRDEAFDRVDTHNQALAGSLEDVYYAYDDEGRCVRDEKAIGTPRSLHLDGDIPQ